jgi:hypothetical protein
MGKKRLQESIANSSTAIQLYNLKIPAICCQINYAIIAEFFYDTT